MGTELQPLVLENTEHGYSTTDFYTTAVLISQEFQVTEVSREGHQGKVKRFHFDKHLRFNSCMQIQRVLLGDNTSNSAGN